MSREGARRFRLTGHHETPARIAGVLLFSGLLAASCAPVATSEGADQDAAAGASGRTATGGAGGNAQLGGRAVVGRREPQAGQRRAARRTQVARRRQVARLATEARRRQAARRGRAARPGRRARAGTQARAGKQARRAQAAVVQAYHRHCLWRWGRLRRKQLDPRRQQRRACGCVACLHRSRGFRGPLSASPWSPS